MNEEYTPATERVRADYAETYEGTDERRYARFDRWLAEAERAAAEKAWHEGFCRGEVSGGREWPINPHAENPYRCGGSDE